MLTKNIIVILLTNKSTIKEDIKLKELNLSMQKMITAVLTAHPEIIKIFFHAYDGWWDSDEEPPVDEYYLLDHEQKCTSIAVTQILKSNFNLETFTHEFKKYFHEDTLPSLGICSKVETLTGIKHFALLDFHNRTCPSDSIHFARSIKKVKECLIKLGLLKGYIVKTDNSFHFYQTYPLLSQKEWQELMLKSRHLSEIGPNWPKFQLLKGFGVLRISDTYHHPSDWPRVIAVL